MRARHLVAALVPARIAGVAPAPAFLEQLAGRIRGLARYDGVRLRAGGERTRAYRDPRLRISGQISRTVRVVRPRRR